jgi:hypothetical protein
MEENKNIPNQNLGKIPNSVSPNEPNSSQKIPEDIQIPATRQAPTQDFQAPSEQKLSVRTINKPEIETMEVHKHPHDVMHKKNWREYILEFSMLFLAVFLGFLAENWREHIAEGKRAKEYAITLLQDIKNDTLEMNNTIARYEKYMATVDSLLNYKEANGVDAIPGGAIYYYGLNSVINAYRMSFNTSTMEQLKYSGNLRYFGKVALKNKISEYDNEVNKFMLRQEIELVYAGTINEYWKLFDYETIVRMRRTINDASLRKEFIKTDYPLLTKDPVAIKQFLGFCNVRRVNWGIRIRDNINPLLSKGRELIALLKKEYHLK